jgi:hypothetical protein
MIEAPLMARRNGGKSSFLTDDVKNRMDTNLNMPLPDKAGTSMS